MFFWSLGDKWQAQKTAPPAAAAPSAANAPAAKPLRMTSTAMTPSSTAPIVALNPPATNSPVTKRTGAFPYRLSNTTNTLGQLSRNPRAILLENALIDTGNPAALNIPDSLRSHEDPGAYLVQSAGPMNALKRAEIADAGATIVSYFPKNAYLVTATAAIAAQLRQNFTVLAWEPYYKVKSSLLPAALSGQSVPAVTVAVFPGKLEQTKAAFAQMHITVTSESEGPFGPQWTLQGVGNLASLAGLSGIQLIEPALTRKPANDLTRVIMSDATDVFVATNYLGLSGSNVWLSVADSWEPTNGATVFNPDLTNIIGAPISFPPGTGIADRDGHATHVAGIIGSSGMNSPTNAIGSQRGADFRGKAPMSTVLALPAFDGSLTDAQLQDATARTNVLISNNSWGYGTSEYGLHSADYDQAVRDSRPGVTGSQPMIYVFSAGNNGQGDDGGQGGLPDSVGSPGNAKNVLTVGASELPRGITNDVTVCDDCSSTNITCNTNQPWAGMTSSSDEVARFSARGNVGIGIEGEFGRFKPDIIAPGTFVVSTRSMTWDTNAYYSPVTDDSTAYFGEVVAPNGFKAGYSAFVPCDGVQLTIQAVARQPVGTDLAIYALGGDFPTPPANFIGYNSVSLPPDAALTPVNTFWYFTIGNTNTVPVTYDIVSHVLRTNELGNYWDILRTNLNETLFSSNSAVPLYRYESGTSMSAPAVAGTLALMEDFFTNQWQYTPSPALMKALVINGARSINPIYDFKVRNNINYQGWGLVNLTNSLPMGMTNAFGQAAPMIIVDQDVTNALATGDSRTLFVQVNTNAQSAPMRITLVWTDPPGNPAASIKLVNDLDLVVTNFDDPTNPVVFFGNDFDTGSLYTSQWNGDTNNLPSDNVNNVENVYILGTLGTNYSITVSARNVNVNALTAHTNGVVQDYALVISSGDGAVTNALVLTNGLPVPRYSPTVTGVTNQFSDSTDTAGSLLLGQRVGASSPLQGTNTISLTNQAMWGTNGLITVGVTNQWHFYVITNLMGTNATVPFTNAAFATFLPPGLSIPPGGVNGTDPNNATRPEADIDLYVARGNGAWGLTNLDPTIVAGADKSLSRGGTEVIVYSNAAPNEVFYVGVKSEDQEAAEYAFLALFSQFPFSDTGPNGEENIHGINVPTIIPDGTPEHPGNSYTIAIAVLPIQVRRVVVTNAMEHENFGDLLGTLTHSRIPVVLNNHTYGDGTTNQQFIYEDNDEGDIPGSIHPDGPGKLSDFIGQEGLGLWILNEQDNALFNTGRVDHLFIQLDPQSGTNGIVTTIQPGRFFYDFIDVPAAATNLDVCIDFLPGSTGPVQLYLRYGGQPTATLYDYTKLISVSGDCLSVGRADLPPLKPGRYYVGVYNPTAAPQTVRLRWSFGLDPNGANPVPITSTNVLLHLPDDALTNDSIFITNKQPIVSVNVGLVVNHPRISDLDITLVSPGGQRVLLFENRGGLSATNLGHLNISTNFFGTTQAGDATANTNNLTPVPTSGTLIVDYQFYDLPDRMDVYDGNIHIFSSGLINKTGTFTIPYNLQNGVTLSIVMNQGNNPDARTQWIYTPRVVAQDFTYFTFTDNTNLTQMPIKFAIPPYDSFDSGTNFVLSDFDLATNGEYLAPSTNIMDLNGGWILTTNDVYVQTNYFTGTNLLSMASNQVSVVTDPGTAASGSNFLALAQGSISRNVTLSPGKTYTLNYLYRGPGIAGWWRGEGNAADSADPEILGNNGSLIGRFNFPAGEVGQAFAMEDSGLAFQFAGTNTYVQIRQSSSLDVGAGSGFTVEGWINPTNVTFQQPMVEWLAHVPADVGIQAGPFLNRATGHYYYLLSQTNWTTSESWANALGGHLVKVDDANEQNWVYDTFAQFAGSNYTMWIGLTNGNSFGTNFNWSTGVGSIVYTNWSLGQPTNCATSNYVAILSATNGLPGLWKLLDNTGANCDGSSSRPFGVVEVNQLQPKGVQFWVSVTNATHAGNGRLYANLFDTTGAPHELFSPAGLVQSNVFQHVALTYNTNTGIANLYYNGTNVTSTNLGVFVPKTGGDVLLGRDLSAVTNNFFWGKMDEMSIYSRFLSPSEILAIYRISASTTNRNIGKFDPAITPSQSLAEALVTIDGITNLIYGGNSGWQVQGFTLTATSNSLPVQFTGLEPGMLLDSFNIYQKPPGNLYYLPEQPLQSLVGSNAYGNWTLEIRDARSGAISTSAQLVSWQLQFVLQTNTTPPIQLSPQTAGTNTVPPGQIAYFTVFVPSWATAATNLLVSATAPVDLLFNQLTPPGAGNPGDFTLINNNTSGSQTLTGASSPPLVPGQTYYLGVRNNGAVPSTVVVRVDFDILTLTNDIPFTSQFAAGDIDRPYVFNVSSNATEATFQLLKLTGNADLVLRKGLPLPNLLSADYGSFSGGNSDETIYVLTNSLPLPLSAGLWYLDVVKRNPASDVGTSTGMRYSVLAKQLTNAPNVINLANHVPLNFTAGPGAALTNFFRFSVTNFPVAGVTNLGIHFELFNQSGNGDLTVQTNGLPLAPPFLLSSRRTLDNAEIIFVRTNASLTTLTADWYLGVPNNETNPISFTILADIDTNSFSAFPAAEGAGSYTRGGALGNRVYHVTTLSDSIPGSLRDGVATLTNGGTIVFDAYGTINLTAPLIITNSFLTIAGQTAPGDGITVAGATTYVKGAHDIILRYLRFRSGIDTNAGPVLDGGFEGQGQTFNLTGYFSGGWHVDSGDIDLLTAGYNGAPSYQGTNFIDLNGSMPGAISTNVPTKVGRSYTLSFAYTKNPGVSSAAANLLQNGSPLLTVSNNATNLVWSQTIWFPTSVVFTATSPNTQIQFVSQTAGSAGIALDAVSWVANDSIPDALQFTNVSNVIVDHISAANGAKDVVAVMNSTNVTVQWSLVSDGLNAADIASGGSSVRYGSGNVTFHHNLYADNYSGNPTIGEDVSLDFVNNVIFNWGVLAGFSTNDIANNPGGLTNFLNYSANYLIASTNSVTTNGAFWGGTADTWIFQTNNVIDTNKNSILDGANTSWGMFAHQYTPFSHPFDIAPMTAPDEAFIAYERVLDFAGVSMERRDSVDRGIVQRARLLPPPTTNSATPLSNMVAWWRAEGNALDSISTNNGTIFGGLGFASGEVGQGFASTGPGTYVSVPVAAGSSLDVGTRGGFSIEGWIKPSDVSSQQPLVEWHPIAAPNGTHLWISVFSQGTLFANIVDTTAASHQIVSAPGIITNGALQHVAVTYDKTTGQANLYYNGLPVASANLGSFTPETVDNLLIGYRAATAENFKGILDEFSVYGRALSSCEIAAIFNAGTAGKQSILSGATNSSMANPLPYLDVDQDGIPDFWEITLGENPTNFSANLDRDGDGYSDLEEYLNWRGQPHALTVTNQPVSVDLYVLSGNTGNLRFSVANGTNGTVYLTNNNPCAIPGNGTVAVFTPTNDFGGGTNYGFGSFTYMVTNTDTHAYFGPVPVSVLASAVTITNQGLSTNVLTFTNPPDFSMDELTTNTVSSTATPTNGVTYALLNPPPFASINPITGVITLQPLEADGPTNIVIMTVATDSGFPTAYATNSFTVTVNEVNRPPVFLVTPPNQTNSALASIVVTNTATDPDVPINPLTYMLLTPPLGATIGTNTGVITWTPTTPGTYTITTVVTDTNAFALVNNTLSATNSFTIVVTTPVVPFAFTQPAQAVTGASAQLNGMATPNGLPTVAWFQWGTTTNYGNQTAPVSVGNSLNVVYTTNLLTGLTTNQAYHFRLVVSNVFAGPIYGFDQVFDEANVVAWGDDAFKQIEVPPALTNVSAIAAAYNHSLALRNNGTVMAWGDNTLNQTNVPAGLTNVVAIAGGQNSSLALKGNGTVTAWGGGIQSVTNVPLNLSNVVMISGGTYSSLALKSSGVIVSWGANLFSLTNPPAGLNNVVEVAAGTSHSLAIRNDGTVVAWGDNSAGQTNVPTSATNVVAIAGGTYHSLALRFDGTVVAWGDDTYGQATVPPGLTNVVAIAAGGFHSLALKSDGSIVAWGNNNFGQGSVPVGLSNVVAISSGYFHNLALVPSVLGTNLVVLPITNGAPDTNSVLPGATVFYQVNVPANADAATNTLLFALSGPLNVWYSTNTPPTVGQPADFQLLTNSVIGASVVTLTTTPQLVPGGTYYLGLQNTNNFTVSYGVQVDFHLTTAVTNTIPITSITPTTINGTNGFLLVWYAPSNELFQVQWTSNLPPTWRTFTNIVGFNTNVNPTTAEFQFFDDGSQTGGLLSPGRFYRLILLNSGAAPAIVPLTNGMPATNTIAPGDVSFYKVNVPINANFATNALLAATGPLNFWFTTNAPPTITNSTDVLLLTNALTGSFTSAAGSGGPPSYVAGTTYYLGVQNTNASAVTYSVEVDFHFAAVPIYSITPTTTNGTNGFLLVWFATTNDLFQVQWTSTLPPTWAAFTNVVSFHTNVNSTTAEFEFFDDGSQTGGSLGAGRFYKLVLLNSGASPAVIPLTNGVPFSFSTAGGLTNFFSFDITQTNPAVLFELFNLTGNGDLTGQKGSLPLASPAYSSTNPGTNYEQIVIRTNGAVPNLNAISWFLGVPNSTSNPVNYTIRAILPTNGILISGLPINTTPSFPGRTNIVLNWQPTVVGEKYEVRTNSNLGSTNWGVLATFTATNTTSTYIDPTPPGSGPPLFYRIVQVP